jgi:hypothetical protein
MVNKRGKTVPFESKAEHHLLLRLDRDPTVQDYATRPKQFTFLDSFGVQRTCVPDLLVWHTNDVIQLHAILTERNSEQSVQGLSVSTIRQVCDTHRMQYVPHNRDELDNDTERVNLLSLFSYRPRAYAHPQITEVLNTLISDGKRYMISDIVYETEKITQLSRAAIIATVCHQIWHGHFAIDLKELLFVRGEYTPDGLVWCNIAQQ